LTGLSWRPGILLLLPALDRLRELLVLLGHLRKAIFPQGVIRSSVEFFWRAPRRLMKRALAPLGCTLVMEARPLNKTGRDRSGANRQPNPRSHAPGVSRLHEDFEATVDQAFAVKGHRVCIRL
jgi:hypothetical protein